MSIKSLTEFAIAVNGFPGQITFLKKLTNGTAATVVTGETEKFVLRDVILAEIIRITQGISTISIKGSSIFEHRDNLNRVLDRLDSRPAIKAGRSKICIDGIKLTVVEAEVIELALRKILNDNPSDAQMRSAIKYPSQSMKSATRRQAMQSLLNLISEDSNVKNDGEKEVRTNTNTANNTPT